MREQSIDVSTSTVDVGLVARLASLDQELVKVFP